MAAPLKDQQIVDVLKERGIDDCEKDRGEISRGTQDPADQRAKKDGKLNKHQLTITNNQISSSELLMEIGIWSLEFGYYL